MRTVMTGLNGRRIFARWVSGLMMWMALLVIAHPADSPKKPAPGEDIFNGTNIVRLNITIPNAGVRAMNSYNWGNGGEKPEARATVTEGSNTYKNVAIHLKGSAGSFRPIGDKPALTLNFDKFAPNQNFHGLTKISLNNSVQDPTFIEEKICREMYEAAGVPVPRADYALVTLNGQNLGLYVLLEGYNKQFLKRYFKNVSGNLYDGGFCREITDDLSVNSGDHPNDKSDLQRLATAAATAQQKNSLTELAKILDIDRLLTMIALEVIQCHWDGYTMNRNNYRVYHDMDSGKMVFMPHGMDQMFGTGDRASPQDPIFPRQLSGLVSGAVLNTTEGRTKYYERLAEVRTNCFKLNEVTNRVRQIAARIRPYSDPYRQGNVQWLLQSIVARSVSLDQQMIDPPKPAEFANGILRLSGWKPRSNNGMVANFDMATSKDGKKLLHVTANGQSASWRTTVMLPQGQYRFEGYARTRGAGGGESGAQLRVSGANTTPTLHGDAEWTMLNFTFEVGEPTREVVLVCELKGNRGEAWFDTTSLKIRRVE